MDEGKPADASRTIADVLASARSQVDPRKFNTGLPSADDPYLAEPLARKLLEFFETKGLAAIKDEDRRELWYPDWLEYQSAHQLYARLLSPREFSSLGSQLDLLRLTRFLEIFGYCSPAHGYSLQVTFLGFFSILCGTNQALKQQAVKTLESGGLLAFGVSEKDHGSDLLAGEFSVREIAPGQFVANGSKYYIGNANCASIISILARKHDPRTNGRVRRAPMMLFAFRPEQSTGLTSQRKIRTLGVRAAYVGEFAVKDYEFASEDIIAEGRDAWDAVFGTVTLGKFFLGFAAVGICEHAMAEAIEHLGNRRLYDKPAILLPHLKARTAEAYARLAAMKMYAYRALDYIHAAHAADRRYLLFTAVQKAKVSTEGVKVMALLSECIGAKGFESDSFFEMALRDAQLIPGLEGSAHINLGLAAQFVPSYFGNVVHDLPAPKSLALGEVSAENPYLMEASTGTFNTIAFPQYLQAYTALGVNANVRRFVKQVRAFQFFIGEEPSAKDLLVDLEVSMLLGACMATIAYGQLIAENAVLMKSPAAVVSVIFHVLVSDLTTAALNLAALPRWDSAQKHKIRKMVVGPRTSAEEWDFVSQRVLEFGE